LKTWNGALARASVCGPSRNAVGDGAKPWWAHSAARRGGAGTLRRSVALSVGHTSWCAPCGRDGLFSVAWKVTARQIPNGAAVEKPPIMLALNIQEFVRKEAIADFRSASVASGRRIIVWLQRSVRVRHSGLGLAAGILHSKAAPSAMRQKPSCGKERGGSNCSIRAPAAISLLMLEEVR